MACTDNIVTLGLCPDEDASLSGLQLIDAPGISIKTLASTANETYVKGSELAMQKKSLAITLVRNDFIGALQSNKIVTTITNPEYSSSQFDGSSSVVASNVERGVTIHKAGWKGNLRQTYIKQIELFPLASGDVDLKIYDGYNTYTYPVTLVGGEINVFDESNLSGFPFLINDHSSTVKVLVNQADINFVSAPIICMRGCNNSVPNPCAWADGWDGSKAVKSEGYGINVVFYCNCNYEQILCDLAKTYSGELIWLKWQIEIFNEQRKTNRFNNWVVYGQDALKEEITELEAKYTAKWNSLMDGALGILNTYRDSCLNCRGIRTMVNV
jgi:hypothetical protein